MRRALGWIMLTVFATGVFVSSIGEFGVIGALIFWVGIVIVAGWLYLAACLISD